MVHELLEREGELAAIAAAVAGVRDGAGQVLVVEGPGGIGKTRLLGAARALAREQGVRALAARGSELERSFTFGVVRQLLEPVLFAAAPEDRERWLSGAAGLAGPMFCGEAPDAGPEGSSYARLHGLYWLCANLASEQALLVAVDDAQWADEPSLSFLGFLQRRLEELPIALVVGTRPRAEALRGLVTDPSTTVLRPAPLSRPAVSRWVRDAVDGDAADAFCSACHETTAGNPFLVSELLREVLDKRLRATEAEAEKVRGLGPESISTVVLARLARLPAAAPEMARALALLGEGAAPDVAAALAGLDPDAAEDAVEALCRADVLTRDGELAFVHPIVLAAIYGDLPARARADGHARAARLLHDRGAAPEEVASQLVLAPPSGEEWAVAILREAARRADALGDPATAATYLDRALAEPPAADARAGVHAELARAEARCGRATALQHFYEAIRLGGDARERGAIVVALARHLKLAGDSPQAIDVLRGAIADLGDGDAELAGQLEAELLTCAFISLEARPLLAEELARISAPARARTFRDQVNLMASAFEVLVAAGPADRAADLAERALAGGDLPMDVSVGGQIFMTAAVELAFCERYDRAEELFALAMADARRRGSEVGFAAVSSLRSLFRHRTGALSEAEADATAALGLRDDVHGAQGYLACALNALVLSGIERQADGHGLLELANEFVATQPTGDLPFSQALHARGWLRAVLGDAAGGLEELLACGAREREWGVGTPAIIPWRSAAAQVHLMLGDADEARRLAAEEVRLARGIGTPRVLGVAQRAAALAETGARRIELLREAVATLATSQAALELARARIDLGAALVRAGRREEARLVLRAGQEGAFGCGARRLVDRAYRELLATGARPRRTAASGRDDLTPSERRVTEMAARGLTNRQIAQALFVTEKTVETHLGRAYSKLGVRSRKQLGDALAGAV